MTKSRDGKGLKGRQHSERGRVKKARDLMKEGSVALKEVGWIERRWSDWIGKGVGQRPGWAMDGLSESRVAESGKDWGRGWDQTEIAQEGAMNRGSGQKEEIRKKRERGRKRTKPGE